MKKMDFTLGERTRSKSQRKRERKKRTQPKGKKKEIKKICPEKSQEGS